MHTTPLPISELRSLRRTTRRAREIAIAIASHPYTKRKALEQLIARGERALTWVGHTMTQRSYGGWNDCPRSLGDLIYQGWVKPEMIPSEPCRPLYVVRDAGKVSNLRAHLAVAAARVNPCVETRTELRDALNQRRSMRAVYHAPVPACVAEEVGRQVRAFGRVENWAAVEAAREGAQ